VGFLRSGRSSLASGNLCVPTGQQLSGLFRLTWQT
jgi:hypothetical protein